ncbi:MAG: ribbon-helix-helix protein, CopG family [Spirochaetes bacterium]|jgi:plasmid stability protein|nr:ribbon-helix-helix protein, CopG family [Spirochaetota bacterium]
MPQDTKRSTIYFDADLHEALRLKAAHSHQSVSEIVNDAVREALAEDQEDLAAFGERVAEPTVSYEALLNGLKADGKI